MITHFHVSKETGAKCADSRPYGLASPSQEKLKREGLTEFTDIPGHKASFSLGFYGFYITWQAFFPFLPCLCL